jgi:hypothetical protein
MTLKINDNGINRDMTDKELAAHEQAAKAIQQDETIRAKELADLKELKKATLTKLGLTADEVTALLS